MKNTKKLLILLLSSIIAITLAGCSVYNLDSDIRNALFTAMQSQGIIDENLAFIESYKSKSVGLFITDRSYYIYEDANGNYIAIMYSANDSENGDYRVYIYDASLSDDEITYVDSTTGMGENYYCYEDNTYSEYSKYELNGLENYLVTEETHTFLFWTFQEYSFELQ